MVCSDDNLCTMDGCDRITGCTFVTIICDGKNIKKFSENVDDDPCTVDTCNGTVGCVYTPVVCNDNNVCTNDTCDAFSGNCTYDPLPLPAGDFCTGIVCDAQLGIIKTPTPCPSACEAACDPQSGCQKCPGSRFTTEIKIAIGIGAGAIAGNG